MLLYFAPKSTITSNRIRKTCKVSDIAKEEFKGFERGKVGNNAEMKVDNLKLTKNKTIKNDRKSFIF